MPTTFESLEFGDVVQINPEVDSKFPACFMVVTEVKSWGAQGYVTIPGRGNAYYRAKHENMEYIGQAIWYDQEDYKAELERRRNEEESQREETHTN